jgi:cyanoexosortase A
MEMDWSKRLQEPQFWLLGITAAIVVLHLTLINRVDNSDLFAISALFWMAAGSLIWDRRQDMNFSSDSLSSAIGFVLLALIFARSAGLPTANGFLKVLPFVSMFGVALLASGFRNLRSHWKELAIFGLLALHPILELVLQLANLPSLTAQSANFMLWFSGFAVQRQGVFLLMPTGRVEVYGACSGLASILQMISISGLFLLLVPLRSHWQKVLCVAIAITIGFVVNAARVALMAILISFSQRSAFDYWHEGGGSLVFSVISVLLFGGFCWVAFLRTAPEPPDAGVSEHG